jgi:hypothetical protein
MIRNLIYTALIVLTSSVSFAQSEKQFLKLIHEIDSAKNSNDFKKLSSGFEKHLQSHPNQWQAYYYFALTNILMAFESSGSEISVLCQKADASIKKADSLSPANSELMVLRSMSSAAMINADGKKNAVKYGTQSNKYAEKAIQLNAENPRAYLLKAKAQVHVPASMGGGKKSALKYYEKSIEKFKTFKSATNLDPAWGFKIAQKEYQKIKSENNGK